jgi:hypothetical protein
LLAPRYRSQVWWRWPHMEGVNSGQVVVPLALPLPAPTSSTANVALPVRADDPLPPAEVGVAPVALLYDLGSGARFIRAMPIRRSCPRRSRKR